MRLAVGSIAVSAAALAAIVLAVGAMVATIADAATTDPTTGVTAFGGALPPAAGVTVTAGELPTAPVTEADITAVQGIEVHSSIAGSLTALLAAAEADGVRLGGWGWRSHETQIRLRRQHCGTSSHAIWEMRSSLCNPPTARPGRSMHERGLAIDFTCNGASIAGTACFRWLAANAAGFGFYNLPSEPWHWSTNGR